MASSSSSSLASSAKYDVFLSFRGEDTRRNFISHLYAALRREKIETFADDEGSTIWPSVLDAIKGSKISAIIFSKGYVSSRWCLGQLEKIMECKKKFNQIVVPVFYDVARSDVRASAISLFKEEEGFKDKLGEVKRWRTALIEALTLSGFDSTNDRRESVLVDKIVKYIWRILNDNNDLFIEQSTIEKIESLLCIGSKDVCTIGIWGLSGIGKTTIAKVVFDKIKYEFDNSYFAQNVQEESESPCGLTTFRQELLFEILEDQLSNLSIFIKQRLNRKRILIVFDDVTSLKQIKTLIGDFNYLGVGSRVIITTRDRQVLKKCGVNKSNMYKVEPLCDPAALQLFSWHAFQDTNPIPAYSELSKRVVKYAKGVPLALKVLGSFLRDKKRKVWESEIDKLKGIPHEDIQEVLRVGYEGLDDDEKNIFLDIACFLKGDDRDFVINLLNASDFFAEIGVSVLKNKSLITFLKNKITMPHLLQEMGREVVREESSKDLRRHTRLWHHKDILQVLEDDLGTKAIEGVCWDMSETTNDNSNPHAFAKMHNLRYLKVYDKHLKEKNINKFHVSNPLESVLTELRYLYWHGYPFKSLQTNFHPENLVALYLSNSSVEELWTGDQNLKLIHLKSINLSHSKNLIKSPDLSCTPNLESLILEGCTSLIEISPSITRLNELAILNLTGCDGLAGIPDIPSKSLRKVFLSSCSNLKDFPNISCNTEELFLDETAIKEILPQSIKNLSRLVVLNLENCPRLKSLPSDICKLKSLEHLNLSGCPELDGWMDSVEKLEALKVLKARGSARIEVPSFIVYLCFLVELNLMNCFISKLPDGLGNLISLESLVLAKNKFELIPPSIVGLSKLSYLDLGYCQKLQSLPELPLHLQYVVARSCSSLKGSSDSSILFPTILRKTRVNFIDCKGLDQDALRIILKNGIQKFPDTLTESCPRPSACICFPGNEIPAWFEFQNLGSSINFKPASGGSNTRLVSFAVCAVVDFRNYHDEGHGLVVGCGCKLGGRESSLVLYYDIGPHDRYSDHVFLGYDLHTCSFGLDDSQYDDNNEVSIQIYVEDSNAKRIDDCEVTKCGVHLLCYQEQPSRERLKLMPDSQELEEVANGRLGLGESINDDLIKKACSMAMKAHQSPEKAYLVKKSRRLSNIVIFSFSGSLSVEDWYAGTEFGEKKIDLTKFPSLKSISTEEVATVNESFLNRFQTILPRIQREVETYVKKGKQLVFTGHSSGGPIAILVTVWFLEEEFRKKDPKERLSTLCITFGSPLVGDRIFNHALSRENWSQYFIHFVMRYDIVPRVLLAPFSSIKQELSHIPDFLNPRSSLLMQESSREASTLYENVMRNVSSLASHAACHLMGNLYNLLETFSIFIKLSPYRPFGNYVFCTGSEELVVVKNPDAVLQILFYSSQLHVGQEDPGIAMRSIKDHQNYQSELQSLERKNVIQLSSDGNDVARGAIDKALDNLGLGTRARMCLCAAKEFKKQKLRNQEKFDSEKANIESGIRELQRYKSKYEGQNPKVSYYDAFRISESTEDFKANVERLKLAGIFDELMEMIKKYDLPDGFEGLSEWIDIGTTHRRLVEPLDIANYYRHGKNFDSGSYMKGGRPKRYRFPQKWLEHAERIKTESISESCFWAEVEDLAVFLKNSKEGLTDDVKKRISCLEKNIEAWVRNEVLGVYIFYEGSTFMKWWETLPQQYRLESSGFIFKQQKALKGV